MSLYNHIAQWAGKGDVRYHLLHAAKHVLLEAKDLVDIRRPRSLPTRLHLGCGPRHLPGFLNVDKSLQFKSDMTFDLRRRFPLPDGHFDFVYSEHVIEHLSFDDGCGMLQECFRVLRNGGVIRLVTPDLDFFKQQPTVELNQIMHEWGHKMVYDFDVLSALFFVSGFGWCKKAKMNGLEDDTPERRAQNLIVEAKKHV